MKIRNIFKLARLLVLLSSMNNVDKCLAKPFKRRSQKPDINFKKAKEV